MSHYTNETLLEKLHSPLYPISYDIRHADSYISILDLSFYLNNIAIITRGGNLIEGAGGITFQQRNRFHFKYRGGGVIRKYKIKKKIQFGSGLYV